MPIRRSVLKIRQAMAPLAVVAAPGLLLIVVEPDLGTALVITFALGALHTRPGEGRPGVSWISLSADLTQIGTAIFRLPPKYDSPVVVSFAAIAGVTLRLPCLRGGTMGPHGYCCPAGLGLAAGAEGACAGVVEGAAGASMPSRAVPA